MQMSETPNLMVQQLAIGTVRLFDHPQRYLRSCFCFELDSWQCGNAVGLLC